MVSALTRKIIYYIVIFLQTTISCLTGTEGLAVSLKLNPDPSAFLYGTNTFEVQEGDDFMLSHYAYTGAACDCATAASAESGDPCEDG